MEDIRKELATVLLKVGMHTTLHLCLVVEAIKVETQVSIPKSNFKELRGMYPFDNPNNIFQKKFQINFIKKFSTFFMSTNLIFRALKNQY